MVLGLLLVAFDQPALPAHPDMSAIMTFQGTLTTGALSYPCFPVTTTTPDLTSLPTPSLGKCPVIGADGTVNVGVPTAGIVPVNVPIGGNPVGFAFGSGPCVGAAASATGPKGAIGICNITGAGTLLGSCDLSIGRGTVNATVSPPVTVGTTVAPVSLTLPFQLIGIGTSLVVLSDPTPAGVTFFGVLEIVPIPVITPGVPPSPGNDCARKTRTTYIIETGSVAVVG